MVLGSAIVTRKDRAQLRRRLRSLLADVDDALFSIRVGDPLTYTDVLDRLNDISDSLRQLHDLAAELVVAEERAQRAKQGK